MTSKTVKEWAAVEEAKKAQVTPSAPLAAIPLLAEVRGKVLRLTLHRKAFEVMVTREKKLEFRADKDWIRNRLIDSKTNQRKHYDFIHFTNGYRKDSPYFICRYMGFAFEYGSFKYSNGLEVEVNNDFAIKCGEIIKIGNWQVN